MTTIQFLSNDSLWQEIKQRVAKAKRVYAAVAYFGTKGSKILPLKRGHKLVVDMSLGAVQQGVTNPHEIKLLKRRGVQVFSRGSLHAKFLVIDNTLIVSSANISRNSESNLDEGGLLTTDPAAVKRAIDFFNNLCTEPVRNSYLDICIEEYHPPVFKAAKEPRRGKKKKGKRIAQAKVWFVSGLVRRDPPENERRQFEAAEKRASRFLKKERGTRVYQIHYSTKPKFFEQIRKGTWVVTCMSEDKRKNVYPPEQVIDQENYLRGHGKRRYLLQTEASEDGESMSLVEFKRKIGRKIPSLDKPNPRTRSIESDMLGDDILRLWTPTGKVRRKK